MPDEFLKAPTSTNTTDAFDQQGIHCYYDDGDRLSGVVLHEFGDLGASWHQVLLVGQPLEDVMSGLAEQGIRPSHLGDVEGFLEAAYEQAGIYLYSSPDSAGRVTSVTIDLGAEPVSRAVRS